MTPFDRCKRPTNVHLFVGISCVVLLLLEEGLVPVFAAEGITIDTSQGCRCAPLPLSVEVTVGEHWLQVTKLGPLNIRSTPQVVIWGEPRNGQDVETLFITRKAGLQRWGQGSDPTKVLYWEALPYWMFRRYEQGYAFPTEENPMPDALTGATPDTDFRVSICLNLEEIHVSLFLEVNMSLDFNEIYSIVSQKGMKYYNKRSGQPSLIYRAEVNLERPGRYEMQLIGHAHPAGANGQLFSDLSGVTTALQMIEQAVVVVGVVAEVEKKG